MLQLRKHDLREYGLALALRRWQSEGLSCALSVPVSRGQWLRIRGEDNAFSGWLLLSELLPLMAPGLSGIAISGTTASLLMNWLSVTPSLLSQAFAALPLAAMYPEAVSEEGPPAGRPLLQIGTGDLTLWIDEVRELPPPGASEGGFVSRLAWPVRCVLGFSRARLGTCRLTAAGDILLIQHIRPVLASLNAELFSVRLNKGFDVENTDTDLPDDMMFDDDDNEEETELFPPEGDDGEAATFSSPRPADDRQDREHAPDPDAEPMLSIGQLPVRLEFVLHRSMLSLQQLQALHSSRLYTLPQGVERRVEILANGAVAGYGELVQLEDRLGVEIMDWMGDRLHHE